MLVAPVNVLGSQNSPRLSVLVVEPSLEELLYFTSVLQGAGFEVTAARSFLDAKPRLAVQPPAVLLTAVRLDAYNGLHLVLRAKTINPEIAALVTYSANDAVLQRETEALCATFVVAPIPDRHLIAAVLQTLYRPVTPATPVRPPFERRIAQRRASGDPFSDERRAGERRKVLPWLVPTAPSSA